MSLTGNKDTDMLILLQLEDHELGPVCQVNSYVRKICNDENFWYRRIVNKITKSYNLNRNLLKSVDKNLLKSVDINLLKSVDINSERIHIMKNFFGFENLKDLNNYLNEFYINSVYLVFLSSCEKINADVNIKHLNKVYIFDENLPKYIDKKELDNYIRREYIKRIYVNGNNKYFDYPKLYFKREMPGFIKAPSVGKIPDEIYEFLKKLGIKT